MDCYEAYAFDFVALDCFAVECFIPFVEELVYVGGVVAEVFSQCVVECAYVGALTFQSVEVEDCDEPVDEVYNR